jgi:hypothetical protein
MPDAPDYTLLSDVNVIGSVTLNVNVVGSVTLNVNVTNASLDVRIVDSTVALNVNVTNASVDVRITGQTINVSITNPTGIPLYVARPVKLLKAYTPFNISVGQQFLHRSLTGRSRLHNIVIYIFSPGPWGNLYNNELAVAVDGRYSFFPFVEIIRWNGGRLVRNTPAAGSFFEAPFLSNMGGWSYAETTSTGSIVLLLHFQLELDSASTLEIYLNVPAEGAAMSGYMYSYVSFYP